MKMKILLFVTLCLCYQSIFLGRKAKVNYRTTDGLDQHSVGDINTYTAATGLKKDVYLNHDATRKLIIERSYRNGRQRTQLTILKSSDFNDLLNPLKSTEVDSGTKQRESNNEYDWRYLAFTVVRHQNAPQVDQYTVNLTSNSTGRSKINIYFNGNKVSHFTYP